MVVDVEENVGMEKSCYAAQLVSSCPRDGPANRLCLGVAFLHSGALCAIRLHSLTCTILADHGISDYAVINFPHYIVRMAVLLKRLTLQTSIGTYFSKHIVKPDPAQLSLTASTPKLLYLILAKGFSTDGDTHSEKRQKRKDAFTNTGRKISERIIHVLDEKGSDLGMMHRADVIRLMDKQDLRLVQRNASSEPPEYQLMTGAQIHQERLRLREQEKTNPKTGRCFNVCALNTSERWYRGCISNIYIPIQNSKISQCVIILWLRVTTTEELY